MSYRKCVYLSNYRLNVQHETAVGFISRQSALVALHTAFNICRPHQQECVNNVIGTAAWLATMYCSCSCINCLDSLFSVNIIKFVANCNY